jgi:hypothetical protein
MFLTAKAPGFGLWVLGCHDVRSWTREMLPGSLPVEQIRADHKNNFRGVREHFYGSAVSFNFSSRWASGGCPGSGG